MRVVVGEGVIARFARSEFVYKLHTLFGYVCEGRHVLLPESGEELDEWLGSLDTHTRSAYREALGIAARTAVLQVFNVATVHVVEQGDEIWDSSCSILNLDSALKLLKEPLGIVLENSNNDWSFLYGIMRKSEREILDRALTARWVETVHGGGSDLVNQIAERSTFPAKGLRTFVLFDSDRRHPDELKDDWMPKDQEACQGYHNENAVKKSNVGGYWRLNRRFIESYMPRKELSKVHGVQDEMLEAYFRLSTHGRWYFNIKKGFKGDEPKENSHRSLQLYSSVSEPDKAALHEGFGRKVADQYQNARATDFEWDAEALDEAVSAIPELLRLI
ncbi:hypothetical protein [Pseudomonas soli]|uniref:hypothetical protein n=1 Tax=Pseudomonas soli TaxID=1306993 RepID=UPI00345D86F1